jgi:hypothetical protein
MQNWEAVYTELCTGGARSQERNCKVAVQSLKGVRRSNEQRICPICGKEEDWSHIQVCERTKISRDDIYNKRFRCIDTEIIIRRIFGFKNIEQS